MEDITNIRHKLYKHILLSVENYAEKYETNLVSSLSNKDIYKGCKNI